MVAYLDELRCDDCGFRAPLPAGLGQSCYLADDGKVYRLRTQAGWCEACDCHTLFERFADAGLQVIQQLHQQQLQAVQGRGWLFRQLRRRAFVRMTALLEAYARLLAEERERVVLLASRHGPCCLSCGTAAKADAFAHAGWYECCRKCGSGVERVAIAELHLGGAQAVGLYDLHGQRLENCELPAEGSELREARQNFEWALCTRSMGW